MSRSLPPLFDGRIHRLTLNHNGLTLGAYHLSGSPAQAVLYGVVEIADRLPDLVVSGINYGENLGSNTTISGTVGAALQGGDMGVHSIAISLETKKDYHYNHSPDVDWTHASHWLRIFARQALTAVWPSDVVTLKIDLPDSVTANTPWRVTRQSRQSYYASRRAKRQKLDDPGALDYEVYIDYDRLEADSDIYAFAVDRVISVTPLSTDLTSRISLTGFEKTLRNDPTRSELL
jgi:5'-nucleotidase